MQINRTTDYGVRVVLHLASHAGDVAVSGSDIAREQGIPLDYIPKVLQALSRAGMVATSPGRTGGARLIKAPKDISVLDIVEAFEGPVVFNSCLLRPGDCSRDMLCPAHDLWAAVQEDIVKRLRGATIDRVMKQGRQKRAKALLVNCKEK